MHSSVTSERVRSGRSARRFRSSAEAVARGATSALCGLEFIDGPEIQIAGDEDLDAITLILGDGRWNVDGALQYLRQHVLRAGRVIDHGPSGVARGHGCLHCAIDDGDQDRRAKALEEMPIHIARESRRA